MGPPALPWVPSEGQLLSARDPADWYESLSVAVENDGVFFLLEKWADGNQLEYYFESPEELLSRVRGLIGQPVSIRVMFGIPITITKGPLRYLRVKGVQPLPLFDATPVLEDEEEGYLGSESDRYGEPVRSAGLVAPPQCTEYETYEDADDEEDEEDDR